MSIRQLDATYVPGQRAGVKGDEAAQMQRGPVEDGCVQDGSATLRNISSPTASPTGSRTPRINHGPEEDAQMEGRIRGGSGISPAGGNHVSIMVPGGRYNGYFSGQAGIEGGQT
jgi:hypothetical protein